MARRADPTTTTVGRYRITPRTDGGERWRVVWVDKGVQQERSRQTRDEAMRLAVDMWLAEDRPLDSGSLGPETPFWLLLGAYLDPRHHAGWRSPNTAVKQVSLARNHLLPVLGPMTCGEVDAAAMNGALELASRSLSDASVKAVLDVLRSVVRWGQHHGCWPAWGDPLMGVGMPRQAVAPDIYAPIDRALEVPTEAEVESLAQGLDAARPGQHLGLMARLSATSGLRWGELTGLQAEDIILHRREIKVTKQVRDCRGHLQWPVLPKHDKRRETIFSSSLLPAMRELVDECPPGAMLFSPIRGRFWRRSSFGRIFRDVRSASEYPDHMDWHALRHHFCCRLLDRGVRPATVSQLAGHGNVSFTLTKYVGASSDYLDEALGAT